MDKDNLEIPLEHIQGKFDLDSELRRTNAWYTKFFAHPQEAE